MANDEKPDDVIAHFELLASALSGRTLRVVRGEPGEPCWTDGKLVYVDDTQNEHEQVASILVQASLISAGSLAPDVLRALTRRGRLAERYLAVEAHRALDANSAVLPPMMHPLIDRTLATRSRSPTQSLTIARAKGELAPLPPAFGTLNVKAALTAAAQTAGTREDGLPHAPKQQNEALEDLDDDDFDDGDAGAAVDMFSAGGVSGIFGRLLQRLLKSVRRREPGGGNPGTDSPTHLSRGLAHRRGSGVLSEATTGTIDGDAPSDGGTKYPEWDTRRKAYRRDWCTVNEIEPPTREVGETGSPDTTRLRHSLGRLALGLDQVHRRSHGDDIDIDAAIESHVQAMASSTPDENVYIDSLRRRRDLSVMVLLDISGSAAEPDGFGSSVHERQCAAAAAITSTLHDLGDRTGLYAYNSQGRSSVQMVPIKRFDDRFNADTMRRLQRLTPSAYSRLGAAIRHGAAVLESQGGTSRRLLIVLSDGLAYDHGYDKGCGAADARRALAEARNRGTGGLCLTFGANADEDSLERVFGTAAHATVFHQTQLAHTVGALVYLALRSADVRRRVS
ncbi:VWA domain-containing protein [Mycobacterium sp. ITM-2016-00316]|uniref:nitric oxide reductase activation protein NorD n=1 Tax=Mycobacterium sp. ITM-2016-00316 TaxID=2099695 RepID=UPI000CFA03FC|nr:VWA domain-containing protein [Mycobacterium sp. ITM-2016-00316]WNG81006.1 VWA domain-containing protein [Mycobacterium sp. ITM-2016-00316]